MKRRRFWLILLLLWQLSPLCAAFDGEAETEELGGLLPDAQTDILREAQTEAGYDFTKGISAILQNAWSAAGGVCKRGVQTAAAMLVVCLACGAVGMWLADGSAVGALALSSASVGSVFAIGAVALNGTLTQLTAFLGELDAFSKALLPTLTAAGIAAGNGGAAVARQSAALVCADLLITLFRRVFVPLVYAVLAFRGAGIIAQNPFFARAGAFCKNTVSLVLRVLLTLYFGYLTVVGLVGGAADTLAKRAAKTAVSAGIPLIGGVLTDAAEAVYAGAALAKNTIGVFGLLAILALAVLPILSAGGAYLCLRVGAALAQNLPETGGREAIDAVADAVGMVFAMCAASAALLLLTVILCMR
ncbi:MAG: hypothetical protein IJC93_02460 [Clostridia bacterium]|nr:hypothetical protein [Clostridia bacterium]